MRQWDDAGLARLQAALVRGMLRFTSAPLGGGPSVRGVLPLPPERAAGRVVVWDGTDLTTSLAYDLPLVDRHGDSVSAAESAAVLRQVVRRSSGKEGSAVRLSGEGHGIPVVKGNEVLQVLEGGAEFDLTDALHAAASVISPGRITGGDGEDPRLLGFLLLDDRSARLYMTSEGLSGVVGLDVSLRDEDGTVVVGITGLASALPALIADDQLRYNPSDAVDPYCSLVFDLTHW